MKRGAASSAELVNRVYTQQPVSCRFCRKRKLKCDRVRPSCFNCHSRNHECIYEADQGPLPTSTAESAPSIPHLTNNVLNTNNQELDLAQRVERLERAVFAKQKGPDDRINSPANGPRSRLASHDEEQQKTSQWLEGLLTYKDTSRASSATSPAGGIDSVATLRDLPTYKDAAVLLDNYTQTVDATYRILHRPTAWNMLGVLYEDLAAGRLPSPTQLSFFLCIFAGSAYVSKSKFQFESPYLLGRSQIALAEHWARQAVSLVTQRPVPPSLEALQTIVSLAHLGAQMDGPSGSFATLGLLGLRMAQAMNIHRLDSKPSRDERRKNGADMVALETKRRVWWHMVASDWLLSFVGGHTEGTYMLHPRQMETHHPSNVEDVDIPAGITHLGEDSYNLPITTPTSMSYFLQRIRSATLVREVVDTLPPSYFSSPGREGSDEVYDLIILLDRKYQRHIDSLPSFFQLTVPDSEAYQVLLQEKPYLEWQRYLINFVLHTQLARIHQPFLIRGSQKGKYEHSRLQCISSAEIVIDIGNRAMNDQNTGSFTYILQHFLTAAITLAMDVCYNPERDHAPERRQQVLRACRALEVELNAKVVRPDSEAAIEENPATGQLMVRSFQNAVSNLRATLRKHAREDESSVAMATGAAARGISSFTDEGRNATALSYPTEPGLGTRHARRSQELYSSHSGVNRGSTASRARQQSMEPVIIGNVDAAITDVASNQMLMVDELWDDFFTMGSNFNDTDWDTFFSDVGANMG